MIKSYFKLQGILYDENSSKFEHWIQMKEGSHSDQISELAHQNISIL